MKIKYIRTSLTLIVLLTILSPITTFAGKTQQNSGGIGYSALMLYFIGDTWDSMPEIYLDYGDNYRSLYYDPIFMHGLEGYVNLYKNWNMGVNFYNGSTQKSNVNQNTSVSARMEIASGGLCVSYTVPIDYSLSVSFATEGGLNIYQVDYMLVSGDHNWDDILDSRGTSMTQNTLRSDKQFYTRMKISMHYKVLDKIQLKLSSGINISSFSRAKWTLNGYVPIAAEDNIQVFAPYLNAGILFGF